MASRLGAVFKQNAGSARLVGPGRAEIPSFRLVRPVRRIHTSGPTSAKYERFDGGYRGPTGPSGRPDMMSFLRRRFGSDRAVWLYGIGIGGGGIYYVAQ